MMDDHSLKFHDFHFRDLRMVDVASFGDSLIIAPHPDDETLGCGGTAALLIRAGLSVRFIFVSDGTMSHPNSKKYPAPQLRELREREAIEAVQILGATPYEAEFLAFPDRAVPGMESPFFEAAVRLFSARLEQIKPATVFLPWQNDPHPDHQSTWQIVTESVRRQVKRPRLVQYPIWLWEMGNEQDFKRIEGMDVCCVDITQVLENKQNALNAHKSQVSNLIDDDPDGFRLSKDVLRHFDISREFFFESKPDN